jgi:hypothetical protein
LEADISKISLDTHEIYSQGSTIALDLKKRLIARAEIVRKRSIQTNNISILERAIQTKNGLKL